MRKQYSKEKVTKKNTDPDIAQWMKEFDRLGKELGKIGPFRNGSLFQYWNVCGTPGCQCKKTKKRRHGPYYSWTKKEKAKTVTLRVPDGLLGEARGFVNNAKLINQIIKEMAGLSDKIIRRKIEIERHKYLKSKTNKGQKREKKRGKQES